MGDTTIKTAATEGPGEGMEGVPGAGWIRVDLHVHSAEDPCDVVEASAEEMVDLAIARGFGGLALTLHRAVLDRPALREAAAARGLALIRGAELRIEGADVVALGITAAEALAIRTLEDLRAWKRERGESVFLLLPHPFYFIGGSIGGRRAERYAEVFDAVEFCHFHAPFFDRNRPAVAFARRHQLPLVATSDAHRRWSFGRHFSWVDTGGERSAPAIFEAIRAGRVRIVSPPCSFGDFLEITWDATIGSAIRNRFTRRRVPPAERIEHPAR